jgi:hypothetical protein
MSVISGRLQDAKKHLETASTKKGRNIRRNLLMKSVASAQLFIATNPIVRDWDTAVVLGNLAKSIASGLEEDYPIPSEDIQEYINAVDDLDQRFNEHLQLDDDLEDDLDSSREALKEEAKVIETRKRRDSINKVLKQSQLGLKSLALVAGDLNSFLLGAPTEDENDERSATAVTMRFGTKAHVRYNDRDMENEEYVRLVHQLDAIEPYLQKMKNALPKTLSERFVVLNQPVLVVGKPLYQPSAQAQNFVARHGIEMGGYWVLKNQIVLGVAKDVNKVVRNPKFRKSVADRLRAIYEEDLDFRIKKGKFTRNQIHKMTTDMERQLRDDLEDEIELMSKRVDVPSLVRTLGKRFGYEVAQMDGSAFVKGSPYTYYWLVSTHMSQTVLNGLYSQITNWDLPYSK